MQDMVAIACAEEAQVNVRQDVLVTDVDLFRTQGGGQTVLRRLIALRPDDRFYYFVRHESPDAPRPANAIGIPFVPRYHAVVEGLSADLAHMLGAYRDARNLAFSVAQVLPGHHFDVVDVPDYTQHGVFIRAALAAEGLHCGIVALALHGTLSSAWAGGWPAPSSPATILRDLRHRETLQFRAVDSRYAISVTYAQEWQAIAPLAVNLVDPLSIVGAPKPELAVPREGPPDLVFVGRREKWKGPDLFLDLAWCVDPGLYRQLLVVGPDGLNYVGMGSEGPLAGIARLRGLHPQIIDGMAQDAVHKLFAQRTLLLLPSRHDTFNLVALEAIIRGCPVLVSRCAGVAQWAQDNLPTLDWLLVDVGCARTAAAAVADVLRNYDARRAELVSAVRRLLQTSGLHAFDGIYQPASQIDVDARQTAIELAAHFDTLGRLGVRSRLMQVLVQPLVTTRRLARVVVPRLPKMIRVPLTRMHGMGKRARAIARTAIQLRRSDPRWLAKETIRYAIQRVSGLSPRTFRQIVRSRRLRHLHHHMLIAPETDRVTQRAKLAYLSNRVIHHLVDRVPLFREMARLERGLGHDLEAATYALRVMRWSGHDAYGDLPFVVATLRANGFPHEAVAAEAMFGPPETSEARCLELMEDAFERNRAVPSLPLAVLDDRRGDAPRRVSVIVSLYNAADKLPTLLACLAQQSLAQRGELEVMLVDSASPANERAALEGFLARQPLPVVYARSYARETIQKAWNRGIALARTPYLAFLGADEGLHPDALRQLADVLDADPQTDWAMANSIVTEVDAQGVYIGDVMPYDRSGYHQDLVYLETCYLSWVGGLYRRSVHDRFGYYDETYRAAGDTEFKNRVLPHIRSVHVPRPLGVFNNYPEERTTAHPRAEIEDLRAWYLWRTAAGMRYAFAGRPADDVIALLRTSLSYRKSFCGHLSTDFDLADALARYLVTRVDAPLEWAQRAVAATGEAVAMLRWLDELPRTVGSGPFGLQVMRHVRAEVMAARRRMADRHRLLFDLPARPHYEVFNDNRYEQHWWSWSES